MKLQLSFSSLLFGTLLSSFTFVSAHPFYPLKPGTTLTYKTGEEFRSHYQSTTSTVTDKTEKKNGQTYQVIEQRTVSDGKPSEKPMTFLLREEKDGTLMAINPMQKDEITMLPAEKQLTEGFTWANEAIEGSENKVIDTDATFKGPDGSEFKKLLLVHADLGDGMEMWSYFEKGTGLVAAEMKTDEKPRFLLMTLSSKEK